MNKISVENKDFIVWNDKFSLGIPIIDEQHKTLVLLTNDFYQAIMSTRADTETKNQLQGTVIAALKTCVDYVQTHFSAEEKLMIAANYPDFKRHKQQHIEFSTKVLETAKNGPNITFTDALNLVKFLYDWVLSHIAHEDKLFVKCILDYYKSTKQ